MKKVMLLLLAISSMICSCKKDKPLIVATLTTGSASAVTASGAQVTGTVTNSGGTNISQKGFVWALHSGPTLSDSFTINGSGASAFNGSLGNLMANSTYYVRAYAINGTGTGYGNEVSFTTSKGFAFVTTAPISNIIALSAMGGGNVIVDGGASVTARGICYSISPHPTTSNFKTSDNVGVGTFTDTLQPLASQTVYYVRAYAVNSYGTAYGNEISFTASSANTVTDTDGNVYGYITINGQSWMTSNLRVTHYQNGDPIVNGSSTSFDWLNNTLGAFSFPNGDSTTNRTLGKLYNVVAVNDPTRNIAPAGWHVATEGDWEALEFYEGMAASDTSLFNFRGTIGPLFIVGGSTGLNLPYGGQRFFDGSYLEYGTAGYFWTARQAINGGGTFLGNFYRGFNRLGNLAAIFHTYSKSIACSVRCVKN